MGAEAWKVGPLSDEIVGLEAGVSVNAEDRPHGIGEIGVLKTSALSRGVFNPDENKAVLPAERGRVRVSPKANSILLSRMNTPGLVGESAYVPADFPTLFLPDRIWQFRFRDQSACSVPWLAHYLLSPPARAHISLNSTGTSGSMKNLPKSRLLAMSVPWPPLPEQQKVAEVLDTIDDSIRKTEQIIAKLKQLKQGLLHDLLTRGIDDNGELRDPERHPEQFKGSPLGRIPKGWEMLRASDVCSKITKGTTPEATAMWQGGDGVRFLRVDNLLFDGRLDLEASDFRVSWQTHVGVLGRSRVFPGDVLTNIVGPPLGKIGLVTPEVGEVNINQAIALLRPTARISSEFLVTWLAGMPAQSWFRRQAKQTSGQLNLTLAMCNALPVPMMSASEQRLIAERMTTVEHSLRAERSSAEKLRLLKTGLMEDLLTGRVRVTPLLE